MRIPFILCGFFAVVGLTIGVVGATAPESAATNDISPHDREPRAPRSTSPERRLPQYEAEPSAPAPAATPATAAPVTTPPPGPPAKVPAPIDATPVTPVATAPVVSEPAPGADREMLALHNELREALDLFPLAWSANLAAGAAQWAETLRAEQCEMRHSDEPYGENLFTLWSSSDTVTSNANDAFSFWADEAAHYDYETDACARGKVCGHYTQIVWAATTELGCAKTRCEAGPGATELWVCRYAPPGNISNIRPY